MIKQQIRNKREVPQPSKENLLKTSVKSMLTGEREDVFLLRARIRQGCLPSPLLFSLVLEVSARELGRKNKPHPD